MKENRWQDLKILKFNKIMLIGFKIYHHKIYIKKLLNNFILMQKIKYKQNRVSTIRFKSINLIKVK